MAARYQYSLRFEPERCDGCTACMRACPAEAVRVRKGRALKLESRCIDCGECIKVCTKRAIVPLTHRMSELAGFDWKIAIPSPALYAQFDPEVLPGVVLAALKKCGFDDVECLSPACDAVMSATEIFLNAYKGAFPLISSFCPTVVRLVQVQYPDLVEQLLPILAPREVSARAAKERKSRESGLDAGRICAVYITPCPSKMVGILEHPGMERSNLDTAVAIKDIFPCLAAALPEVDEDFTQMDGGETASGVSWAFMGGFPRSLPSENTLAVAGLPNVIRILDDIEKGKLRKYAYIETHACPEGCVGGCLTVENPYVARGRLIRLMHKLPSGPAVERDTVEQRYDRGEYLMDEPLSARPMMPLDADISKAIAKMKERDKIVAGLPGIDCGACGAPSCKAFAEDIVLGEAEEENCVFVWRTEITDQIRNMVQITWPPGREQGGGV